MTLQKTIRDLRHQLFSKVLPSRFIELKLSKTILVAKIQIVSIIKSTQCKTFIPLNLKCSLKKFTTDFFFK